MYLPLDGHGGCIHSHGECDVPDHAVLCVSKIQIRKRSTRLVFTDMDAQGLSEISGRSRDCLVSSCRAIVFSAPLE